MPLFPECFYSNRLENLFERFAERLFCASHPLTRRLVVVPSPMMRTWLLHQLAKDENVGVAAGIEFGFIEPTLQKLNMLFSSKKSKQEELSVLELVFALEKEMLTIIQSYERFSLEEKKIWKPMLNYLHVEKGGMHSLKVTKRMHALADQIARLFFEYGRIGGVAIANWNKSQSVHLGWQENLWLRMEKLFAPWNYSARQFSEFTIDTLPLPEEVQVHVFGLSYLLPMHHKFFTKLSEHIPVNYYWLSPCQKFWSDIVSNKEAGKISNYWQKQGISTYQQEELESYLNSHNPLLANFGKLGREMAIQIENSEFVISEAYVTSSAIKGNESYEKLIDHELHYDKTQKSLTLLNALQADLVLLRNPADSMPLDMDAYDNTIQVHEAPKLLREVQIMYDRVLAIIDKHSRDKDPILPQDILVMAPDIGVYSSSIKSVFGSQESVLNYQIMDLKMPVQNAFVQGFLHLLRLSFSRWDAVALLKLFDYSAFQNKGQFSKEDMFLFRRWFKHAGICWGQDGKHRNELLKRDHCFKNMVEDSWAGTWEHGLGRLLEGLAILPDDEVFGFSPLENIQSTQSDLLGLLMHLLSCLREDLKPLSNRTKMTLENWSIYLKCLLEAYFKRSNSNEDVEGYNVLIQQFEEFSLAARKLGKGEFEFHSIYSSLESALQLQLTTYRESHLHTVRFCSLQPMRAIPVKVVVLLGMQEGSFPRSADTFSLNLLHGHPHVEYYPSKTEFDRYLFLETLLSARDYLLISYVSCATGNGAALLSPLVSELLSYLKKAFTIKGGDSEFYCRFQHPLLPFDARYFSDDKKLFSYSEIYYRAACAHYENEKKHPHCFLENFHISLEEVIIPEDVCINLKDLQAFARNPIKSYFNKALGIYLDKDSDRIPKKEEDLHVSYFDTAILSRQSLFKPIERLLDQAELAGQLPRGAFKEVSRGNILDKSKKIFKYLKDHGINSKEIFSIECSERYRVGNFQGAVWQLPPLQINTSDGKTVKIVGLLENISREGVIYFGKDGFESAVKIWPSLLVLCCLIRQHNLSISPRVFFVESSKPAKSANFDEPERLLLNYVEYYFKGQQSPSPLLPDWVMHVLTESDGKLQELYDLDAEDPFKPTYDDYLKWLKKNSANTDIPSAVENWNSTAQALFVDLKSAWYSKASVHTQMENQ